MQPQSCPSTSRHLVQSAARCLLAWIGHVLAMSLVKKELNQTPLRTSLRNSRYDAARGPQPEMSPSISMRSVSCSAHFVVQGAGGIRCCQCLHRGRATHAAKFAVITTVQPLGLRSRSVASNSVTSSGKMDASHGMDGDTLEVHFGRSCELV